MIGKNTTAKVSEVLITAKRISFEPSLAAVLISMPSSNFLKIFSVTTIPSSTTSPVAKTIASSVSTLILKPAMYMMKNAPTKDTGISINGRKAMLQFLKNTYTTNTTSKSATTSVSSTSLSARFTFLVLSSTTVNSISSKPFCF